MILKKGPAAIGEMPKHSDPFTGLLVLGVLVVCLTHVISLLVLLVASQDRARVRAAFMLELSVAMALLLQQLASVRRCVDLLESLAEGAEG